MAASARILASPVEHDGAPSAHGRRPQSRAYARPQVRAGTPAARGRDGVTPPGAPRAVFRYQQPDASGVTMSRGSTRRCARERASTRGVWPGWCIGFEFLARGQGFMVARVVLAYLVPRRPDCAADPPTAGAAGAGIVSGLVLAISSCGLRAPPYIGGRRQQLESPSVKRPRPDLRPRVGRRRGEAGTGGARSRTPPGESPQAGRCAAASPPGAVPVVGCGLPGGGRAPGSA